MSTTRELSKENSGANGNHIDLYNVGSFQRIADAIEKIAGNWDDLIASRNRYQRHYESEQATSRALRGQITKLRKKLAVYK